MRAGIGARPRSRAQVAGRLHVSERRVRRVERRAVRRLRAANRATGCAAGGAPSRVAGTGMVAILLRASLPGVAASIGVGSPGSRTLVAAGANNVADHLDKHGVRGARTSGDGGRGEVHAAQGGLAVPTPFGALRAGWESLLALGLLVLAGAGLIAREFSRATR